MTTPAEMALNLAAAFFRDNAGFAYNPKTETSDEGKVRHARELAVAEMEIQKNSNYRYEWAVDPGMDSSDFETDEKKRPHRLWCVTLYRRHESIDHLGGVDFGANGSPKKDSYRRVVEAEIALAHLDNIRAETAETARLDAFRTAAEGRYDGTGDTDIDADARVSESEDDGGAWVAAWVWVSDEDAGIKRGGAA